MKLLSVLITLTLLTSCGYDNLSKAGQDVGAEVDRFKNNAIDTYDKALSDTKKQGKRSNMEVNSTIRNASHDVDVAGKKANQDFLAEKDRLKDRLVGSNDKQIESVEAENRMQDEQISELAQSLADLGDVLDDVEDALNKDVSDLYAELERLSGDLSSRIDDEVSDLETKLEMLEQEIADVAAADSYCKIRKRNRVVYSGRTHDYIRQRIRIVCPRSRAVLSDRYFWKSRNND